MITDFRSGEGGQMPLEIARKPVENVKDFTFLRTMLSANLK